MIRHMLFNLMMLALLSVASTALAQTGSGQQEQQSGQQQTQGQSTQQGTIELGDINLERSQELPQVQILDRRKDVMFDEVQVAKDFQSELSGKSEELKMVPKMKQTVKPIKNIKVLLNKNRF